MMDLGTLEVTLHGVTDLQRGSYVRLLRDFDRLLHVLSPSSVRPTRIAGVGTTVSSKANSRVSFLPIEAIVLSHPCRFAIERRATGDMLTMITA